MTRASRKGSRKSLPGTFSVLAVVLKLAPMSEVGKTHGNLRSALGRMDQNFSQGSGSGLEPGLSDSRSASPPPYPPLALPQPPTRQFTQQGSEVVVG